MQATRKNIVKGVAAIVVASMLWSVTYLIRKRVSADLGPFTITFLEAFSGALLTSLFYRIGPRSALQALRNGGWGAALMALLGVTVANSALVVGFQHIDLGVASILEKTQPIFTVILAALFLKERLSFLSIGFGLMGIIGAVEVIPLTETGGGLPQLTWETAVGVLAVICAAATWAGAGVLGRKLAVDDLGPVNMAFLRAAIGAASALPLCLLFEPLSGALPLPAVGLALFNGLIDSVFCYVLYYHGMRYIAAGVTSIIEIITPVGAVLLGVFVLGEHLSVRQCAGAAIVLAAVTALVWNEVRLHARSAEVQGH